MLPQGGTTGDMWWHVGAGVFVLLEFDASDPNSAALGIYLPDQSKEPAS